VEVREVAVAAAPCLVVQMKFLPWPWRCFKPCLSAKEALAVRAVRIMVLFALSGSVQYGGVLRGQIAEIVARRTTAARVGRRRTRPCSVDY
jgi:hypothetical protein